MVIIIHMCNYISNTYVIADYICVIRAELLIVMAVT